MLNERKVVRELQAMFGSKVLNQVPFPKSHPKDKSKVRAIYLGCDPSNKHCKALPYAFALESKVPIFNKFIQDHTKNLAAIGLNWETVHAQNLCQNYFKDETSKNQILWKQVAAWWIPKLKEELEQFESDVAVLLTSGYLYDVLVKGEKYKPIEYYECRRQIPIPSKDNHLERPLIPVYRHFVYHLSRDRWKPYREAIMDNLPS